MNNKTFRKNELSLEESDMLLKTLKSRFEKHMNRHKGIEWNNVQKELDLHPQRLWSIAEMERTGGEPDVVVLINILRGWLFVTAA